MQQHCCLPVCWLTARSDVLLFDEERGVVTILRDEERTAAALFFPCDERSVHVQWVARPGWNAAHQDATA